MLDQASILIVDDEAAMRDSCRQALSRGGNRVDVAEDGLRALEMMKRASYDVVILDLKMPGLSGMEVLKKIKARDPDIMVLIITGYATVESAVEAMRKGAYDFIPKPFTPEGLRIIVDRATEKRRLVRENVLLRAELEDVIESEIIIGRGKAMKNVEKLVLKAGPVGSTVLITGESGTGKELIARAVHRCSRRKDKPFVAVDCGSLVETLFESELFGHVKGSFTGATETKYGRFELANGGTLFFDEIGNISENIQSKLLRVLQEREITKVGSAQVVKVDVRIVSATNRNLQQLVKEGKFRDDLFYRLSVVPIELPPLRERREEIPLLVEHFLSKYNKRRKKNIRSVTKRAMKALIGYDWPGNVRELENAIERAVVLTEGEVIEPDDLMYYGLESASPLVSDGIRNLDAMEKEHIIKALKSVKGYKGKAAEALGIDRKTLRLKMRKYKID